jgi:subtilisin-like proprotein convertase family protein
LAADLEELGYFVVVHQAEQTDPAGWSDYDLLVVSCGDNTSPMRDATVRSAVEDYVLAGGHLLIEGGELGYDAVSHPGYPSFAEDVLHTSAWSHDRSGDVTITDPQHHIMRVPETITGPLAMDYNGYGDHDALTATDDAEAIGGWSDYVDRASIIAYDPNPSPAGGQIVFLAFHYAAMSDPNASRLLQNAVTWLLEPERGDCSISGTVTLYGQQEHAGVAVRVLPGGGSTLTGPAGDFHFSDLHHGAYRVVAARDGYAAGVADVELFAGQQLAGLAFVLKVTQLMQECRDPAASIPDNDPTGLVSAIAVAQQGQISAVEVFLDIEHSYPGDLVITLTSPAGTSITLHDRNGSASNTVQGWYPQDRTPEESLGAFLGDAVEGDWKLRIIDHSAYNPGTLRQWCLKLSYADNQVIISEGGPPQALSILANAPNPFNPRTQIIFELPRPARVDLGVYDLAGRRVATLLEDWLPAGRHQAPWDGRNQQGQPVASAIYLCRLRADGQHAFHKMLLLR